MSSFLKENFNNEGLNLTLLQEECAEVIHIISKIKRFGLETHHPRVKENNRTVLEKELGDLILLVDILISNNTLKRNNITIHRNKKLDTLGKYYENNTNSTANK